MVGTMECWNIGMLELAQFRVFESSNFSILPVFQYSILQRPMSAIQSHLLRGGIFTIISMCRGIKMSFLYILTNYVFNKVNKVYKVAVMKNN